jgi:hypothetical protein
LPSKDFCYYVPAIPAGAFFCVQEEEISGNIRGNTDDLPIKFL